MRHFLAFAALLGAALAPVRADDISPGTPPGWLIGGHTERYEIGTAVLNRMRPGTQIAYLRSRDGADCGTSAALYQTISAETYRGKRVQLSARLSGGSGANFNSFALFAFAQGRGGATRPVRAFPPALGPEASDFEWARTFTILNVPPEAERIVFGFRISGPKSTYMIDAVRFETVPKDIHPLVPQPVLSSFPRLPQSQAYFRGSRCGREIAWLTARGLMGMDERDLLKGGGHLARRDVQLALAEK